jgi:type II secretion system protein I
MSASRYSRPKGPSVKSQGRKPLGSWNKVVQAPRGRKSLSPLWRCHGLIHVYQGLTPQAINDRRVAAESDACKCIRYCDLSFHICPFRRRLSADHSTRKRMHPRLALSQTKRMKPGFTLLEVILSLAILAGALAALGEVMRLADRSASTAEDETHAQIMAASIMDELSAGSRELTAISQTPLDTGDDPPWLYTVEMTQTQYDELVSVRVRVEQDLEARLQPAKFELVRWMPNPDYVPPSTGDDSSTSSTTGSSSSTSGSSATSGSGGQK